MASTTTNLSLVKSGYVRENYPTTVYPTNSSTIYVCCEKSASKEGKSLFLGFLGLSSSLKNRVLYSARLILQSGANIMLALPCTSDFNPSTLCYNNKPDVASTSEFYALKKVITINGFSDQWYSCPLSDAGRLSLVAANILKYAAVSIVGKLDTESGAGAMIILSGGGTPYLEVTYDDSVNVKSKITPRSAPSSGYVNPRNTTSFSWAFERDSTESYYCAGDFTQASASLKWKTSGGSWNTISASGSTQSLSVPANTFPTASTIEWYLTGTDTAGTTSETAHYTFSTAAGTVSAKAVSPVNSVEDGSQPITLRWNLSSTDGQAPAYIDLWWKLPSDQNWTAILSHVAAKTNHTVAAGFFPSGECQWMVRGYNVDDVAGPWSYINGVSGNYPSFVCVAAPDAPVRLQATQVPRSVISWQSEGQEAYEIEVDGISVVKEYGPGVSSWQLDEPLKDGTHTIRVRIQGVYGLWSSWATVSVGVENTPATTAELSGSFDVDAVLSLTIATQPDPLVVQWYRDGKRIGRTTGTAVFTDRFVLGLHSWYAELWYSDGNYVRSNTVSGTLKSCKTRIALLEYDSPWLDLSLSENSDSVQAFSWSQTSSLRHVRGAVFPVLELGEFEDLTGTYDCAFTDVQTAEMFEVMKGQIVILKSRGGQVLIGALTKISKRMKDFYITYSFSVQQIHYEDFVSYDENS